MKNKIIIGVVAIVILIAAVFAVITISNKAGQNENGLHTYENMDEAAKNASFNMEYPDRLCGFPVTGFRSNSSMIEARYGNDGFIRKTLGVADNSGNKTEYSESTEQSVNGLTVTLKGNDGLVFLAVWNDNNFDYTISVANGVNADEMTEYIEATK